MRQRTPRRDLSDLAHAAIPRDDTGAAASADSGASMPCAAAATMTNSASTIAAAPPSQALGTNRPAVTETGGRNSFIERLRRRRSGRIRSLNFPAMRRRAIGKPDFERVQACHLAVMLGTRKCPDYLDFRPRIPILMVGFSKP